jgi:hypothetical protein
VSIDEYYKWFSACGYSPTGEGTVTTVDMYNPERKKFIQIPRPDALSPEHRREAAENMGHYFGWGIAQGVH